MRVDSLELIEMVKTGAYGERNRMSMSLPSAPIEQESESISQVASIVEHAPAVVENLASAAAKETVPNEIKQ